MQLYIISLLALFIMATILYTIMKSKLNSLIDLDLKKDKIIKDLKNELQILKKILKEKLEKLEEEKTINKSLRATNKKLRTLTKRRTNGKDEV